MKGIAVQKIILLLLGIIVLAIIGYLLYTVFLGARISPEVCKAALVGACTQCKLSAWNANVKVSGKSCTDKLISEIIGLSTSAGSDGNFDIQCSQIQGNCKGLGVE